MTGHGPVRDTAIGAKRHGGHQMRALRANPRWTDESTLSSVQQHMVENHAHHDDDDGDGRQVGQDEDGGGRTACAAKPSPT